VLSGHLVPVWQASTGLTRWAGTSYLRQPFAALTFPRLRGRHTLCRHLHIASSQHLNLNPPVSLRGARTSAPFQGAPLRNAMAQRTVLGDITAAVAPVGAGAGGAGGKAGSKTIEQMYQKKTQLEHILLRPDTYSASTGTGAERSRHLGEKLRLEDALTDSRAPAPPSSLLCSRIHPEDHPAHVGA
jgi:hypothetical protein